MDLMLEDIFKLPNFKKTFERAIGVHSYIYNRPSLLNMMRSFTQLKELVKPAKTRFATAFLTLQRLYQQRNNLRKMFTSEEWTKSKWAKEPQGKKTAQIMLMPSFWNHVHLALQFSCPLVHVLRMVDGEEKPPMGYIYEAMDRAKEAIANAFDGKEEKYKEIFEIIDQRLIPTLEIQDKVCAELAKYEKAEGLFQIPMAIRQRSTRVPGNHLQCSILVANTFCFEMFANC
ncbi:uncharacterized protein LOC114275578 isoform X2 [Camellia sinensis]|uniref:uncharacterized protein LOC114275578 isoform X2 n=1 Tax=Camellia sinensis TaxID=4442 RepID=UPI001036AC2F|nr:uncharacterized protein LOC114275578 isoform X2 [Camellia sinensis]